MKKVLVLLSTYNGEKYLKEQLDSILNQTIEKDMDILIRDDGSSDGTRMILEKYCTTYSNIKVMEEENVGVKKSFFSLIALAEKYEYYAFADQDDYWKSEKLEVAIKKIEQENNIDIPVVYFSKLTFVNEYLEEIQEGINPNEKFDFGNILIKNNANGCTMVFNYSAMKLMKKSIEKKVNYENIPLHDHWLYMAVLAVGGKVVFDENSYILYRQHNANQVGMDKGILDKIKKYSLFNGYGIRYRQAEELYRIYFEDIKEKEMILLEKILRYKTSLKNRLKLAFDRKIKPTNPMEKFRIIIIVLNETF